MTASARLPQWLDELIFTHLGAKYCRSNSDMTVIDWDKSNVLNYLGTYFPRSYTEAYSIYSQFFSCHRHKYGNKDSISVFDFGCGTGGEVIGLLTAIEECLPLIRRVDICGLDGNQHALRLFENVIKDFKKRSRIEITYRVVPVTIDDLYDLSILDAVLSDSFDIIMTFKAICEFVTKEQFEKQNPYNCVVDYFLPKLNVGGIMLLVDVTTYSNVSSEWLPKMMDKGLQEACCKIVQRNDGYNQAFSVAHSRCQNDLSKVAWRIIQ